MFKCKNLMDVTNIVYLTLSGIEHKASAVYVDSEEKLYIKKECLGCLEFSKPAFHGPQSCAMTKNKSPDCHIFLGTLADIQDKVEFSWSAEDCIKALGVALDRVVDESAEDTAAWEYRGELQGTIDDIRSGVKTPREACDWIAFAPYLKLYQSRM